MIIQMLHKVYSRTDSVDVVTNSNEGVHLIVLSRRMFKIFIFGF